VANLFVFMAFKRYIYVYIIQELVTAVLRSIPKETFADSFQKLYECCQQCVVKNDDYFEANEVNLFVTSVLFVFWYHSPKFLDTPHICDISRLRVNLCIFMLTLKLPPVFSSLF
jgi:hypothetical protein